VQTLPSPIPREASKLLQPLILVAALVVILVMSNLGWAASCSTVTLSLHGGAVTCTIPEGNPELTATITLTGLTFTAQASGMVLLYDDSAHTILSDVVTFTDVGGVATVTFLSDTDGVLVVPPGLPILGKFSEGTPIFISLALGNGNLLNTKICSDMEVQNCNGASDSIRLSEGTTSVPEPGTLLLLGSGLLGSGAWKLSAGSLRRRRLLKRIQS
jgi:PEP-CTERM motif